ncbi:hypothetical protein GCM10025794_22910 [Massilia kyonggiensis]
MYPNVITQFGRPESIMPLYDIASFGWNGWPSTVMAIPPSSLIFRPVASTTTSAGTARPDASSRPSGVKRSMWSVATLARPVRIARNRSPSGTTHTRWSQGL